MKVGVIGLGYVGLPLAVAFAEAACDVVGIDTNSDHTDRLSRGESPIEDIPSERLAPLAGERISFGTDPGALTDCDAIVICVPTPIAHQREPDLSYVDAATEAVATVLREGQLVVLESTTYPGTTRDRVAPILEKASGLVAGEGFHLAFSPSASTRAAPTTQSALRRRWWVA